MNSNVLTGALEANILTALVWSAKLSPEIALQVRAEMFSTPSYGKIATVAISHLQQFGRPIEIYLQDFIEDEMRRSKLVRDTVFNMQEAAPHLQIDFIRDQLANWIEMREMVNAITTASDLLAAGQTKDARDVLRQRAMPPDLSPGILLSDPAQALRVLDRHEAEPFTTGIDVFTERGILPARGTQFLFMAPPKRGKSWFLVSVGKANIHAGYNVLHVTLENSEELTAQRYIQALYAMTVRDTQALNITMFDRDGSGQFTGYHEEGVNPRMLEAATRDMVSGRMRTLQRRGKLYIKSFPTGTLTTGQLDAYMDWMAQQHGFVPDVLLVDYPDLMSVDSRNRRLDLGRVFVELRGQAVIRNHALVTVTQGNRDSVDAKVVKQTHVAEDFSKIATADVIITYNQTEGEKQRGLARLWVDAARAASDQFMVYITQSYPTGQFALDSIFPNSKLNEQLGKKDAR